MAINSLNCIGSVYVMSNDIDNTVVYYMRDPSGALFNPRVFNTGGNGAKKITNKPSETQNSIITSPDHRFLFVVNQGNNTISSFLILEYSLKLISVVDSLPKNLAQGLAAF